MTQATTAERDALRQRRDRLTQRSAFLYAETERLTDCNDAEALRALSGQLHEHSVELVAYHHVLELFHGRLGPLS